MDLKTKFKAHDVIVEGRRLGEVGGRGSHGPPDQPERAWGWIALTHHIVGSVRSGELNDANGDGKDEDEARPLTDPR